MGRIDLLIFRFGLFNRDGGYLFEDIVKLVQGGFLAVQDSSIGDIVTHSVRDFWFLSRAEQSRHWFRFRFRLVDTSRHWLQWLQRQRFRFRLVDTSRQIVTWTAIAILAMFHHIDTITNLMCRLFCIPYLAIINCGRSLIVKNLVSQIPLLVHQTRSIPNMRKRKWNKDKRGRGCTWLNSHLVMKHMKTLGILRLWRQTEKV